MHLQQRFQQTVIRLFNQLIVVALGLLCLPFLFFGLKAQQKNGIGERNVEGRNYLTFVMKELCVANIWFEKKQKKKHTVWVEMKLRLILYWFVKAIESI